MSQWKSYGKNINCFDFYFSKITSVITHSWCSAWPSVDWLWSAPNLPRNPDYDIASSTLLLPRLISTYPLHSERTPLRPPLMIFLNRVRRTYKLSPANGLRNNLFSNLVLQVQVQILYTFVLKKVLEFKGRIQDMGNFIAFEKLLPAPTAMLVTQE